MKNAFSLIELLIVITIVGLLAAIAVPVYQQYSERTKLATAVSTLYTLVDKAKVYYGKNGEFPILQQLGEPTEPGNEASSPGEIPPASLNDYYIQPYIMGVLVSSIGPTYTCKGGVVTGYVSNVRDGPMVLADTSRVYAQIVIGFVDYNNAIKTACVYNLVKDEATVEISGDYIPNCTNLADEPTAYDTQIEALFNSC